MKLEKDNRFRLYVPLSKSNNNTSIDVTDYKLNENGTLDIEGIASTINKDLQGDKMLPSAIESMKKQLLTLGKNLHGDHKPFLFNGLLGAVNKVYDSNNDKLHIGATVLSKYAPDIKEMLDIGVNLGYSIGGAATKYTINKSNGLDVADVYLDEISLTAMPANLDTLGTVTTQKGVVEGTCINGICHQLAKNLKKNRDEENNMSEENNQPQNNPEDVDSKIKSAVEELWAEKEQGLVDAITESIKPEIKNIVQEEMKKEEDNSNPEDNNGGNGENPEGVEKSFDSDAIGKAIAKGIQSEMAEFKKQFFKDVNEGRDPNSNLDLQHQEDLLKQKQKEQEGNQINKTYSTEETAKILMKRQRTVNPIMGAVLNNLGE